MYKTDATTKFIIMCDIEKRAKMLTREHVARGGMPAFCASYVGYMLPRTLWREARDAGFKKEADGRWIGFTSSYHGDGAYAVDAYKEALNEKKAQLGDTSFLDDVQVYEYLT